MIQEVAQWLIKMRMFYNYNKFIKKINNKIL